MVTLMLSFFTSVAMAVPLDPGLIGLWRFTSVRYQDKEGPIPNPKLILNFEFHDDGQNILFWTREGEHGFCRRTARYTSEAGVLKQVIETVDPDNAPECASDPDMQQGKESQSNYRLVNDRFELDLLLGAEAYTYIWTKQPPASF